MDTALETTNFIAAALNVVVALLILLELRRVKVGASALLVTLVLFFVARTAERVTEPEFPGAYSQAVDLAVDLLLIGLLLVLIVYARKPFRALLSEVERARKEKAEYARARRAYEQIVRHRMMNPLMVIRGAAETLAAGAAETPAQRDALLQAIIESTGVIENVALSPERRGPEERELNALPQPDEEPDAEPSNPEPPRPRGDPPVPE